MASPRRFHQIIRLKPEQAAEYKRLHAAIPPAVADAIHTAHIVDYSIAYEPALGLLCARFTYQGQDLDGDMAQMQGNEEIRRWWSVTDPMQASLLPGAQGSEHGPWWKEMEEVFYQA